MQAKKFADLWRGIFFLVSSVSLVALMSMFFFVWQPIWTAGFKDFHSISVAIIRLNETAKPTSELAPAMLSEIKKMNVSMARIETNMNSMNHSLDTMGRAITGQMYRMNYEVDEMGEKFSPFGMMPFNW